MTKIFSEFSAAVIFLLCTFLLIQAKEKYKNTQRNERVGDAQGIGTRQRRAPAQ
jgi:hypothetical protein